jgi:hypothetical protein
MADIDPSYNAVCLSKQDGVLEAACQLGWRPTLMGRAKNNKIATFTPE